MMWWWRILTWISSRKVVSRIDLKIKNSIKMESKPIIDAAIQAYNNATCKRDKDSSREILKLLLDNGGLATPNLFQSATSLAKNGDKSIWEIVLKRFTNLHNDETYSKKKYIEVIGEYVDYSEKNINDVRIILNLN